MDEERPDQELEEQHGWEPRRHPMGGFVYSKPGTYGWFGWDGAWAHEVDLTAGEVKRQYPSITPLPAFTGPLGETSTEEK